MALWFPGSIGWGAYEWSQGSRPYRFWSVTAVAVVFFSQFLLQGTVETLVGPSSLPGWACFLVAALAGLTLYVTIHLALFIWAGHDPEILDEPLLWGALEAVLLLPWFAVW